MFGPPVVELILGELNYNHYSLRKSDKSLGCIDKREYHSVQTTNRLLPLYFFHIRLFGTSMELIFSEDDSEYFCILVCNFFTAKGNRFRMGKSRPCLISISASQIREFVSSQSFRDTAL